MKSDLIAFKLEYLGLSHPRGATQAGARETTSARGLQPTSARGLQPCQLSLKPR